MAIDGVESELAHVSIENGKKESKVNGHVGENESGSHLSESARVETTPDISFPKDAVDEWPEARKFHSVYFVKYRTVEDLNLKTKLDQADKELKKLNLARDPITEKLRAKRNERAQVIGQLKALVEEKNHFRTIMDGKRKEIEPLQQALGKLRGPRDVNRDNKSYICSSEEELNDVIKSLQYHIQHESITLNEEKQIIRDIKQLGGTRDKVIANAAMRAEVQKSVGEKDAIQDQVKAAFRNWNTKFVEQIYKVKLCHGKPVHVEACKNGFLSNGKQRILCHNLVDLLRQLSRAFDNVGLDCDVEVDWRYLISANEIPSLKTIKNRIDQLDASSHAFSKQCSIALYL